MSSASRQRRLVRSVSAAAFATFVALFSHVIGGGAMPSWIGILLPLVGSMWVCVLLAGRKLSPIRLSLSVAASQFLFHLMFSWGTASDAVTVVPSSTGVGHHHGNVEFVVSTAERAVHDHADGWMLLGHAVAALVTIVVLYSGERILLTLAQIAQFLRSWWRRVSVPVPGNVQLREGLVFGIAAMVILPSLGRYASSVSRRGPPTLRLS